MERAPANMSMSGATPPRTTFRSAHPAGARSTRRPWAVLGLCSAAVPLLGCPSEAMLPGDDDDDSAAPLPCAADVELEGTVRLGVGLDAPSLALLTEAPRIALDPEQLRVDVEGPCAVSFTLGGEGAWQLRDLTLGWQGCADAADLAGTWQLEASQVAVSGPREVLDDGGVWCLPNARVSLSGGGTVTDGAQSAAFTLSLAGEGTWATSP